MSRQKEAWENATKEGIEAFACLCASEPQALLFLVNLLEEAMAGVSTDRST